MQMKTGSRSANKKAKKKGNLPGGRRERMAVSNFPPGLKKEWKGSPKRKKRVPTSNTRTRDQQRKKNHKRFSHPRGTKVQSSLYREKRKQVGKTGEEITLLTKSKPGRYKQIPSQSPGFKQKRSRVVGENKKTGRGNFGPRGGAPKGRKEQWGRRGTH